jgi:NTF2 fold immunity protein
MKFLSSLCVLIAAAACAGERQDMTREEAVAAADAYVQEKFSTDTDRIRPTIYDRGETWLIKYQLPPDAIGGAPTVEIDKKSRQVVSAFSEQ